MFCFSFGFFFILGFIVAFSLEMGVGLRIGSKNDKICFLKVVIMDRKNFVLVICNGL